MPSPTDKGLFANIQPRNLLSFGPEFPGLELRNLNVLIGPNGSGKSNLIEAISFIKASATDWSEVIRKGGGLSEWIWKGSSVQNPSLFWTFVDDRYTHLQVSHRVEFLRQTDSFVLAKEAIDNLRTDGVGFSFYHREGVLADLRRNSETIAISHLGTLLTPPSDRNKSVIVERRDSDNYPEFNILSSAYAAVRIYRDWSFGRGAVLREPQRADERNDFLLEDFSNLGLVLSKLAKNPKAKRAILEGLSKLYQDVTDYQVHAEGGTVQVFFTEGDFSVPATRLSDGTIRFLCLLAILCDPSSSSSLICIEEPELGLHPDVLPAVADLLRAASERTQIVVTTHSDIIIDALSDIPECVVVCEKHEGQTEMKRLDAGELKPWLEQYRLGQLWSKGQLGGNRW